ncbi:RNA methyltransferase, RsmE family protein [Cryptosporidium serpentis]
MNLIIINPEDINENMEILLSKRQSNHCVIVLGVSLGSKVFVGVKNSGRGTATVIKVSEEFCNNTSANRKLTKANTYLEEFICKDNDDKTEVFMATDDIVYRDNVPAKDDYLDKPVMKPKRRNIFQINSNKHISYSVVVRLDSSFHKDEYTGNFPVIDLLVALPRPKVFDKVLQYAASIGVGRIIFVCTNKSEKSYLNSSKLHRESIHHSIQLGLEQACNTLFPEVYLYASWNSCLKYLRDDLFDKNTMLGIIADNKSNTIISDVGLQRHTGSAIIAVGPEGGWSQSEVSDLIGLGFKSCSIGSRVLKVEAAMIALCSQAELLLKDKTIRNGIESASRSPYWSKFQNKPGNLKWFPHCYLFPLLINSFFRTFNIAHSQ